jgi:hypothetical protein
MNLGPSLLVGLDPFVQQHLADLDSVGRRCATRVHKLGAGYLCLTQEQCRRHGRVGRALGTVSGLSWEELDQKLGMNPTHRGMTNTRTGKSQPHPGETLCKLHQNCFRSSRLLQRGTASRDEGNRGFLPSFRTPLRILRLKTRNLLGSFRNRASSVCSRGSSR